MNLKFKLDVNISAIVSRNIKKEKKEETKKAQDKNESK